MANHKWVSEKEYEYGTKPHRCKKCGVSKKWLAGDMKCWEYSRPIYTKSQDGGDYFRRDTSLKRPECNNKDNTLNTK